METLLRPWIQLLGMGFHPDTRGADYINLDTGAPSLTPEQAAQYDHDIEAAFAMDGDPYSVGLKIMEDMGLSLN